MEIARNIQGNVRFVKLSSQIMLTALIGFFVSAPVVAANIREAQFPRIATVAAEPDGFVPKGWALELQDKGDLNGDGRDDLVLVLRDTDPANVISHDGMCESPFNTNPRILVVAFARPDGQYALTLRNQTLIPKRESSCLDDPLENGGVGISRGTLRVTLGRFASAGSWEMGSTTYTFRWQDRNFVLIGYDDSSVMRNTGETRMLSVNYSTGKAKMSTGHTSKDGERTRWVKLRTLQRWTLDQVGDSAEFFTSLPTVD
ncbi:hypothetical protein [Burkholderia pyrrocinia]|uniref:hypothetical protein n=1 Tax=Burkholderia pyrrocinia TaxID=60550 RepID=UPI002AB2A4D7|nr:hypothetical protein [Burkholderia pyrrocinia]